MLISEFYDNQVLFITGGSGFIGKALIEKLLRSCPGIAKIYFLVRTKDNKSVQERLERTLKDPGFRRIWQERPELFKRIQAIEGDCNKLQLGMTPADIKRISDVTIIIHSAATVRFDEPIRDAIFMNTRSTHELVKIAMNLRNLKAFVHVSTTYSNPAETELQEKVYEPNMDWRNAIQLAEHFDPDTLDIFTYKIGNTHPNTYTFTKNLGEKIVDEYKDKLPVVIFRPSIVVSSIEEPIPGWIDNINGPIGLLIACGIGIKRSDFCDPNVLLAIVPVDIVVRGIITCAYKVGTENGSLKSDREISVYNCALNSTAPITIRQLIRKGEHHVKSYPFEKTVWAPGGIMYQTKILYLLQVLVIQMPFSILLDGMIRYAGKKPIIVKLQRILVNTSKALHLFMFKNWNFRTEKFFDLENSVPIKEKEEFGFLKHCYVDYEKYYPDLIRGMRQFILNEPRDPSSSALKRIKIFIILHKILKVAFAYWLLQLLYRWIFV